MGPTIQLIHLTVRAEREAEAQCHSFTVYRDDFADEEPVRRPAYSPDHRIKRILNLFRRQQPCEYA